MRQPEAAAAPARPLQRGWDGASRVARALTRGALWLADRPVPVLAALVVVQWLALIAFALTVRHNGLVYYQGGDQINYSTNAWLLGNGQLPPTVLGYGWVVPLVPVGWLAAADYVSFLPLAIALNVLVLGPIVLACVYALAARVGGRLLGLWAAALWVAAPYLAIPLFRPDYHDRYVEQFLPQALGLSLLADFPSMACLLVAAYLLVRLLDTADWSYALLAGLAAGVGVSIKPANLLFLAGPAVFLLLSRRFRHLPAYVLGILPPLLLLALWKQRGLGSIPAFALEEARLAAGTTLAAPLGVLGIDEYVSLDLDVFRANMANLREFFYSARVLQWLPFAGALAVARRSVPVSGLLFAWFGAFLIAKGTRAEATVESGSLFRLLMPAFPAYFLLAASLPLLIPTLVRRIPARLQLGPPRPIPRRILVAVAAVFVVLPAAAVALPQQLSRESPDAIFLDTILTPVEPGIEVAVRADGAARTVSWSHRDFGSTDVFYRVFRTAAGGSDFDCSGGGSASCELEMLPLAVTRAPRYEDLSPPEDALYRIGVATNWENNAEGGDVIALSPPVAATP